MDEYYKVTNDSTKQRVIPGSKDLSYLIYFGGVK